MIKVVRRVRMSLRVLLWTGFVVTGLMLVSVNATRGQSVGGNNVSGYVFGIDRRPLADVYVELLNDLNQTVRRSRTNASGQYSFYGITDGRFYVRVLPLGTDYEGQTQEFEIDNIRRRSGSTVTVGGFMSEQRDFYLRPRRGVMPGVTGAVFVQEIPDTARKLYQAAVDQLTEKKKNEAYESLKSALEIFPKYFDALELLGIEYVRDGHFDAARILLSIAVEVNPRAYKSWHALAAAFNALNAPTEAIQAAEKSVEINPLEPQSMLLLGMLLRQAKRYADADKRLTKANELFEGKSADTHWELALLYGNGLKRYRDAARELKTFLKMQPDHKNAENIKKLIVEFEEKAKTSG
jgi:hypothetical protein